MSDRFDKPLQGNASDGIAALDRGRGIMPSQAKIEHWKYPLTVGSDMHNSDHINFNSHESSEYAIKRMGKLDIMTNEPYVMFEFMEVNTTPIHVAEPSKQSSTTIRDTGRASGGMNLSGVQIVQNYQESEGNTDDDAPSLVETAKAGLQNFWESVKDQVQRDYGGSISLYMPTDIQINDTMVYSDDNRTMGALAKEVFADGTGEAWGNFKELVANPTTLISPASLAITGGAIGKVFGDTGAMIAALAGGATGAALRTELQRGTGQLANPNEISAYTSTNLRTFTFTWTILPDSKDESEAAAGLIKFMRKSAHARKETSLIVTVPDHVIVSFHGAQDMIQLPPVVIDSVGVTYNPNNTSFFKQNNAPVEIGLTVGLKELAPIYRKDVEAGY